MSRRRVVAIFSAALILLFGVIAAVVVASITQTGFGREWVRRNVSALVNARLKGRGSIYIGHLSGGFLTQLVIDSVAVRDEEDSLFVATGRVRLTYDPRDLIDLRLRIATLDVQHPLFNIRRHADRQWNFKRIFPPGSHTQRATQERALGDYIVVDSLVMHDGTVILTMPWHPDDWLRGRQRDSAITAALASHDHVVRHTKEGLKQTWRWTGVQLTSPRVRLADPDSAGQLIVVGSLRARESDPPLNASNMTGQVRILGDTAWFDIRHFDLPASTGHAQGTIRWGGDDPVRYAVHIVGDSVSLRDIDWVYPTLPTTGGGRMELDIHNDPHDLHVLEYALTKLDIRSTRSRLRGAMTFATGKPVLAVKDVSLTATPVNFDLLRTLNGQPFPVDWQGNITGTVQAPGGPLDRFQVNQARFTFHDAHVPGAVSRGTASGGLDIQHPARTVFHDFDVRFDTLDLRSVEYLFPNFPRLHGTISGSATLDSSWLDVRFRNADLTHHDGSALPTHATGSGRVTYGKQFLTFDVDMQVDPLSFSMLAQSYPTLPFRGPYTGPLRVKGTLENMDVGGTLTGAAGIMSANGHFDFNAPDFAARATGSVQGLDLRALLERPTAPSTALTGSFTSDLHGDSLANLAGTLAIALQRSRVDSTALLSSLARLSFGDGRVHVDSLLLVSDGARLRAWGGLGLVPTIADTLQYAIGVDALDALRPYMASRDAARDSLGGTLAVQGALAGSVRDMSTTGTFRGTALEAGASTIRGLSGSFAFSGVPTQLHGTATVVLDTIVAGRIRLSSAHATVDMPDRAHGRVALTVTSDSSPASGVFRAASRLDVERAGQGTHVTVDTLGLTIGDHAWFLTAPTHLALDSTNVAMDSLVLRNGAGGTLAFRGQFPVTDPIRASFLADSVPLADLGALTQSETPLGGFATITGAVAGTRTRPTMRLDGRFAGVRYGDVHLPFFTLRGTYADRRLDAGAQLFRDGQPVLSATALLPLDLSLVDVPERKLLDPLTGRVSADSVDLALLGAMSSEFTHASGTASADIEIGGTWQHPTASGRFTIHNGSTDLPRIGIRLRRTNADIRFVGDSITVQRLSAVSGSDDEDSISIAGMLRVPNYAGLDHATFDLTLRARNFEAFDKRSLAKLQLSGGVRLSGGVEQARLAGAMTIDQGTISLPELARKSVVSLNESDPDFYDVVDTTFGRNRGIVPQVPPLLKDFMTNLQVPDLRIGIGDDVWLRSDEANIKLGGAMELTRQGGQRLSGTLRVVRGTYRLDLGLVRRTFQVDSGSIVFYGDPEISPTLDIYATYVVRQVNRQDVHIIAHVGGTLANPTLGLTSSERYDLSLTEILSYLTFGAPSFALGGTTSASLRPVASALLPTIGGVIERQLSNIIGVLDYVQVQPGSVGDETSAQQSSLGFLWGSRIGIGKQIGERTFVTANYGLCKFGGASNQSLTDALGVTVERRLDDGYSVQASAEPASTALLCGRVDDRDTPRQFGFDLFREWSF